MPKSLATGSAIIALAMAGIEATAYGWMHPAATGHHQPVLAYRPSHRPVDNPPSTVSNPPTSTTAPHDGLGMAAVQSTLTPLPEIVARSLPSLRCSTGIAARIDRDDGVTIHLAFFEWNAADSTNVLEAFRHLPEECMGSIGMQLLSKEAPLAYTVDGETLWFDHTVFRDPRGVGTIHAFKGTWVSGAGNLIGPDFRGGGDQWREIHWKAALYRFHPAYARVAQGAVRGTANGELAWQAFQTAMLTDLRFE